jgi:hypothetical protein
MTSLLVEIGMMAASRDEEAQDEVVEIIAV